MDDQKIENLLNLSLDATQEERRKSESLEIGFDEETQTWEVIVRYSGDLQNYIPDDWHAVFLSGGYAIITLPQDDVSMLASMPLIEYVEKPKRMYFSVEAGRRVSCISALQTEETRLFGRGILIAVIDSGVDYFHPDFRTDDGSTRILAMWDQTAVLQKREISENPPGTEENVDNDSLQGIMSGKEDATGTTERVAGAVGKVPAGFMTGVEYTREDIDRALRTAGNIGGPSGRAAGLAIVPEQDLSGHGTQVLGITAGNGRASGGRFRGVAPESDIVVVKLGTPREQGFPRTTELMQALEYVYQKAEEFQMPMAVNISFGNAYGSHRGTSLLETYIDMMAARGRSVIAVGTGNEGNTGGHVSGKLQNDSDDRNISPAILGSSRGYSDKELLQGRNQGEKQQEIELLVSEFETSLNLQIWKNYVDDFRIRVIAPDGGTAGPFGKEAGASRYNLGGTDMLVYFGEPSPYQSQQEIYIDFIPQNMYIESGVWRIVLIPERIVTGEYQMWLNDSRARNPGTRFQRPTPDVTLTIPSAASQVIAVGAYDARQNAYALFSGRGWEDSVYGIRPDLAAPGVDITTTAAGGGYVSVTGTSFATPFVTGASALLMEWGIVLGKDQFLYGEKVKAYLQRGARKLPGYDVWPNNQVGYGALCLRDSFPE